MEKEQVSSGANPDAEKRSWMSQHGPATVRGAIFNYVTEIIYFGKAKISEEPKSGDLPIGKTP